MTYGGAIVWYANERSLRRNDTPELREGLVQLSGAPMEDLSSSQDTCAAEALRHGRSSKSLPLGLASLVGAA